MTMANNRQKFYALAIYWLRDYSRNFGVETLDGRLLIPVDLITAVQMHVALPYRRKDEYLAANRIRPDIVEEYLDVALGDRLVQGEDRLCRTEGSV